MTDKSNLISYRASMAIALEMLIQGFISPSEYSRIDTVILRKYGLKNDDIYCRNPLINQRFRANMSANEGNPNDECH